MTDINKEKPSKKNKKEAIKAKKKERFIIKMEILAPVSLNYAVMAESAEEALQMVDNTFFHERLSPTERPRVDFHRLRKSKVAIHQATSNLIVLTKKF